MILANRYDFSDSLLAFTIDCDETKDMDDAVSLTKDENGHYILGVHIADVAHYVKEELLLIKKHTTVAYQHILLILLSLLYPIFYQMVFVHLILILKDLPKVLLWNLMKMEN